MNDDLKLLIAIVVGIPSIVFLGYRLFFWPRIIEQRLRDLEDHII